MGKAILSIDKTFLPDAFRFLPDLAGKLTFSEPSFDLMTRSFKYEVESDLIPETVEGERQPQLLAMFYQSVDEQTGLVTVSFARLEVAYQMPFSLSEMETKTKQLLENGHSSKDLIPILSEWQTRLIYENQEIKAIIEASKIKG